MPNLRLFVYSVPLLIAVSSLGCAGGSSSLSSKSPPLRPRAPKAPNPSFNIAARPDVKSGIRVNLDTRPSRFPAKKGSTVIVAVPAEMEGEKLTMRQALIRAFLSAGYTVKDAGAFSQANISVHRYPATDSKVSTRRVVESNGEKVETSTESSANRGHVGSKGLTVSLADPTSIWASELLNYKALKSSYFLRIFRIQSGLTQGRVPETFSKEVLLSLCKSTETICGALSMLNQSTLEDFVESSDDAEAKAFAKLLLSGGGAVKGASSNVAQVVPSELLRDLPLDISEDEHEKYMAAIEKYNQSIDANKKAVAEYTRAFKIFEREVQSYNNELPQYNRDLYNYTQSRGNISSYEELLPIEYSKELIPRKLKIPSMSDLQGATISTTGVPMRFVKIEAEVVAGSSGDVTWAGTVIAVGLASQNYESLVEEAILEMTQGN